MSNELEAFIEYISVIKMLSSNSISAYKTDLVQIEVITNKSLVQLNSDEIFDAFGKIENKKTLNRKLSALNSFFDFCYSDNFITVNSEKFELSKVEKKLPKYMTSDEIFTKLKEIELVSWLDYRNYAFILVLYATGMRVSEALNLDFIDIEDEWIKIRNAKGDKERIVPIAPKALNSLKKYLSLIPQKLHSNKNIWLNYKGQKLSRISAFKIIKKYLGVSPHILRHSYATSLILGGADLRFVQELLGHSSLLTTQIYTHIEKENLRDTVVKCHPLNRV